MHAQTAAGRGRGQLRSRLCSWSVPFGTALLVTLLTASAGAAELELQGPASCSDREQLEFHVSRLLKEPLAQVPQLAFVAKVSAASGGYAARLVVTDTEHPERISERRLQESSCPRLLEALGVVIVLTIHGVHAAAAEAAPTATPALTDEPALPLATNGDSQPLDPGAVLPEQPATSLEPGIALWLLADAGALPEPALGVGVSVELTRDRLRLLVAGALFPEQRVLLEGRASPTPGADLGLALGSLAACYAPLASWQAELALGVCVRGELGRLYGQGVNLSAPRSDARWWIAPALELSGSWKLRSALLLNVQLGGTAPLSRPPFHLGELGELYRPAALTLRAGVGVAVVFQ